MNYFDSRKKVAEYILMTDGYDGREVIKQLHPHLATGSTILEIGMGPGRDIPILQERYRVTGSDISVDFLNFYREKHPDADLLELDAVTLETDRTFDCIFSNKVMHYLAGLQLNTSFTRQCRVLNPGGVACHTFWYGDKEIEAKGMRFYYYTEQTLVKFLPVEFELVHVEKYREMDVDDSMLVILKKKEGC